MKFGLLLFLTACGGGLNQASITEVHNIQTGTLLIYQSPDPDAGPQTANGQVARAVWCAADALARDNGVPRLDAGGAIDCPQP